MNSYTVTLSGNDVLEIKGRVVTGWANGKSFEITYPEDMVKGTVFKNGAGVACENNEGRKAQATLRVPIGGNDDKWFNELFQEQKENFSNGFVPLTGSFTKITSNENGIRTTTRHVLRNGFFQKNVETFTSSDGDVEQAIVVYHFTFLAADERVIQ